MGMELGGGGREGVGQHRNWEGEEKVRHENAEDVKKEERDK